MGKVVQDQTLDGRVMELPVLWLKPAKKKVALSSRMHILKLRNPMKPKAHTKSITDLPPKSCNWLELHIESL